MTDQNVPRRTAKGSDQLRALTMGLAAVPEPPPDTPAGSAAGRRSAPRAAREPRKRPGPMKAEQKADPRWGGKGAQINLTVDKEMKRALALAQVDDGIETTARLRAMISLWQEDERLAARINRRAADLQGRGARRT